MTKFTKYELHLFNTSIELTGRTVYKYLQDINFNIKESYIKGDYGYYTGTYKGVNAEYKFICESNKREITRLELTI